ncbi:MAG: hypothetical protein ACVCEJ_00855 [Candidatus Izemoplasmataceae bacterium]
MFKRLLRDRSDGKRIKAKDPFFRIIPYVMKERSDAQVFFEETIKLDEIQNLTNKLRKEGMKVRFVHFVIASVVRVLSQKPKVNRFIAGKKAYSRNEIAISIVIKKSMDIDSPEAVIKMFFSPTDTLYDIVEKVNKAFDENAEKMSEQNNTDKAAKFFNMLPGFLLNASIGFIKFLDNHRMMPKFLIKLSPFHSSVFVVDLGSIGISSAFHHIYNFGTTTVFMAFGTKDKEIATNAEKELLTRKTINIKYVVDERVVDGYYFASAIKMFRVVMHSPEQLLEPPLKVEVDDEV